MEMEIDAPGLQFPQIKGQDLFRAAESDDTSAFRALSPEQLTMALSLTDEDGRSVLHVAVSSTKLEVRLTSAVSCFVFLSEGICSTVALLLPKSFGLNSGMDSVAGTATILPVIALYFL